MASKPGSAAPAIRATASLVGNTFVSKYYNVLHQSPQVVHRFYTEQSILSRAEAGPSGAIDIVISQAGIDQKIMSLDYRDFRAEIKTVDSLESLNGSVLVMVTGSLSSHGLPKRSFVQTFFLAPQEVGYFVLNDMFRYLDGEPEEPLQLLAVPMSNGTIQQHIPAPEQGEVDSQPSPQQEARDYSSSSLEDALPVEQQYEVPVEEEAPKIEEGDVEDMGDSGPPEEDDVAAPSKEQLPPAVEESNPEEAPKKSYASILRVRSDVSGASAATPLTGGLKPAPPQADRYTTPLQVTQPAHASVATSQSSDGAISPSEGPDENTPAEVEGDGRSVYVKNLPLNITVSELEDAFNKFGTIKPGGVNLRNQTTGVCFAFIEFDEPSSARSVIEASPILIGGRLVFVEEKKPMAPRAGRGRFNQGRGYQNNGMRGRGYFGGRGSPRGSGQDFDREGGRGSGAGRGSYGGGNASYSSNYGSNFNIVNGYRRADGQGWNGSRPVRTTGNQAGRMGGSVLE